jgi:hypothetical protein
MIDQIHPPEGRLSDQQRAVMRADLMAASHETARPPGRRWSGPVGVAAAVATLVGFGFVLQGNDDRGGTTGVPVASSTSGAPSAEATPSTPSRDPSAEPSTAVEELEEMLGMSIEEIGRSYCDDSFRYGAGKANTPVLDSVSYDGGTTYLYEAEDKWWYCDDWTLRPVHYAYPERKKEPAFSMPQVSAAHSLDDDAISAERFILSQAPVPDDQEAFEKRGAVKTDYDGDYDIQLLAAGPALDGVTAISYAFPTGEVVDATVTDKMWQVVHVMPSDEIEFAGWSDPVVVTVTMADGSTQQLELTDAVLRLGVDCAETDTSC